MTNTIPDIIKSILNKVPNEFPLSSIVDNGDGTANILTCNTWWALECTNLKVGGIDYKIKSIDRDVSITVTGLPVGTTYVLTIPFFISGTPIQSNIERELKRQNQTIVTPMFYLFEPIKENFNNELDSIQREVVIRFATLNNYKDKDFTGQIYDYSIIAMRRLTELFIITLQKQIKLIDPKVTTYSLESFAKYGSFKDLKGSTRNIFNENLSGTECFLTISLKSQSFCLNLCNN